MKYSIKIQRNKSFSLPAKIKNDIKSKGLDNVEWTIDYNNNSVRIKFLKNEETRVDYFSEKITRLYRHVYSYSMIKIPSIVYIFLKCKIFDYIVIEVRGEYNFINTCKRITISEISGLIKESGREY